MKKFVVGIVFVAASFFGFMNQSDEEVHAASKRGTVIIDAGHGGKHTGTCGITGNQTRYCEKNANLSVALKLETLLESKGYTVKMTRTTDKDFASYITGNGGDLDKRTQYANSMITDPDQTIVISIHHNGHPRSTTIRGIETYFYNGIDHAKKEYPHDPASIKYLPDSKRLAEEVHEEVVDIHNAIDRGIHDDQSFFIIRNSKAPAILAELGYMTNPQEEALIKSSSYQQKSATAIATAVDQYFKVFEVYEADTKKRIGLFDTKDKAIAFAEKQDKQVYVLDKYNQSVIYDGVNYSVYSKDKGLLKEFYKLEDAISFAEKTPSTRITSIINGHTIWSNYLEEIYIVMNSSENEVKRFIDYRTAENYAKTVSNTYILKSTTNEIVWSSLASKPVGDKLDKVVLSGADRILTSINVSKNMYPSGFSADKEEKTVILATGYDFADALSAGPLSTVYGNAPILLSNSTSLSGSLKNELTRLKAKKVVIIGGEAAISSSVEKELDKLGYETPRISGASRYHTNENIVKQLGEVKGYFVASGESFADALSVAPIAASLDYGIVLTDDATIRTSNLSLVKGKEVKVVGGTAVIQSNVYDKIKSVSGSIERLAGNDRYKTLTAVLREFADELKSDQLLVTIGTNYPDATSAAPLAATSNSPLILVSSSMDPSVESFLFEYGRLTDVDKVKVVGGGTPSSVVEQIGNIVK